MEYQRLLIGLDKTVRDAMRLLDEVIPKILFVEEEGMLRGALTDGDIRRYLLNGGSLDSSSVCAANPNPLKAMSVEDAISKYNTINYIAIPIIDEAGIIIDIYVGEKRMVNTLSKLCIPVVINAGGRGTRLDPFTKVLPKPLIPVGDLPIIEHIMKYYAKYACEEYHVIVNYKKELMKAYFAENENHYDISWYDENEPLGTGGGLSLLKGKIHETFFFTSCDTLLESDYSCMLKFHREHNNAITMICAYKNLSIPYGVIEMGKNGSIEAMKEKPELSFLTNTGVYIVEPEVLDDIEDGVAIGFPDVVELQRKKGRNVAVYPLRENEWLDMGQMSELEKMRNRLYGDY